VAVFVVVLALVASAFSAAAFAATPSCGNTETVTVRILGYDAGSGVTILKDYRVQLNGSTGYTALAALETACATNKISYDVEGSGAEAYVDNIAGEEAGYFTTPTQEYYDGWLFRVWPQADQPADPTADALPSVSAGAYTLGSGDQVTWYYDIPASTWYTVMANYGQLRPFYHSGQTVDVSVYAQKYVDTINWQLTPFEPLDGATVTLTRVSDGKVLATATSDANGNAELQAPALRSPTRCRLYVANQEFTTAPLAGALENVQSWSKEVMIGGR
jgi:hypothetical protein